MGLRGYHQTRPQTWVRKLAQANEGVQANLLVRVPSPILDEALLARLDKLPLSDTSIGTLLMGKCNHAG